jgi:hypothetical protein
MNRVLAAARLHVVHPLVILGMPWVIVLTSYAINEAIWGFGHLGTQPGGTGGVLALYITVAVAFLQSVTQLFPFALSMGLSRRTFYAGTALMAVVQSLGYALVLTALTAVEDATGGWWTGLHFFAPLHLDRLAVVEQIAVFFLLMLGMTFLGIAIGAVVKRWGQTGTYLLVIGTLVIFGAAAVLVTGMGWWSPLGTWLVARSALTIALGYAVVVGLISAGLSYAGLRRAVP